MYSNATYSSKKCKSEENKFPWLSQRKDKGEYNSKIYLCMLSLTSKLWAVNHEGKIIAVFWMIFIAAVSRGSVSPNFGLNLIFKLD